MNFIGHMTIITGRILVLLMRMFLASTAIDAITTNLGFWPRLYAMLVLAIIPSIR